VKKALGRIRKTTMMMLLENTYSLVYQTTKTLIPVIVLITLNNILVSLNGSRTMMELLFWYATIMLVFTSAHFLALVKVAPQRRRTGTLLWLLRAGYFITLLLVSSARTIGIGIIIPLILVLSYHGIKKYNTTQQ
jgi:hypothetical protein